MWILRLTDLEPFETSHELIPVDVSDPDAVIRTAEGMDAIVNLSVLRPHRQIAFDVNTMGCYNMMRAAVAHGIRRVINTGPHFTVQGAPYERWDYHLGPRRCRRNRVRICMRCRRDWGRRCVEFLRSITMCCVTFFTNTMIYHRRDVIGRFW